MMKKAKVLIIALLLPMLLFFGASYTYSAINEKIYNTIRVAYMNGFIDAVEMDLATIKKMQGDRELLQQEVEEAVGAYVDAVRMMNK